ncbi:helix-turn-helix domain-containing protein [Kribbella sandramycini]|uniref:Helix-turn-helix domain-containing protein n=1 Tax=Kribbella sandramycini TaxID=60450 RepID=A0A7Y4L151_9ACTN|nr:helix-turn-helix transcriptional regulator [Kribbella sandramycini]MBB6564713.1 transcriptional regulator with XRE-family HTH domain [Kribbella sandramycini]NOL42415.1 helix-turn-helix domain-containing protein [Kribbella sandramycini]
MSSVISSPDSATCDYPAEFARQLARFRERSGFSVRELAERANCSHSQIVRATGPKVPTWKVAKAFLAACGFDKAALDGWQIAWQVARDAERELSRDEYSTAGREWFWSTAKNSWSEGMKAASSANPVLVLLRDVETPEGLGNAIRTLASRAGHTTVRAIADASGVAKSTMQRWLRGERPPTEPKLRDAVVMLGATPEEREEFLDALRRLNETPCAEPHPDSQLPCVQHPRHRGWHTTSSGLRWLDDGPSFEMLMRDYRANKGDKPVQ